MQIKEICNHPYTLISITVYVREIAIVEKNKHIKNKKNCQKVFGETTLK